MDDLSHQERPKISEASRPGVIFFMKFPQPVPCDMGVNLRGGDVLVAQHDLDGPKIGPPLQEMAGKRMTEGVRG